jgi:hypothetical protein
MGRLTLDEEFVIKGYGFRRRSSLYARGRPTAFTTGLTTFQVAGSPPPNTFLDASIGAVTRATTYYYRVESANTWGVSAWSNTGSVTVTPPLPHALTSVTVTAAAQTTFLDSITVSWVNPAGNNQSNFRIQYSLNSTFTNATTVTVAGTATSHVITGLRKARSYYVRVQPYNTTGAAAYTNATPFPVATP